MSDTDHLYIKPTVDVEWGAPKTIRQLIAQLETMDPDIKVHGALHTEYDGKPVARCRYLSMSFERVDQPWIRARDQDAPYALVFWTQEDEGVRTPPEIPAPVSNSEGRAQAFARQKAADLLRSNWLSFCDADAFPGSDTFADAMEAAGFIELVLVTKGDLEDAFAAERGIEPGGMVWKLTDAGRVALSAASEGSNDV